MDTLALTRPEIAGHDREFSQPFAPPRLVDDLGACFFYHTLDLPRIGTVDGSWDLRGRFGDYVGQPE